VLEGEDMSTRWALVIDESVEANRPPVHARQFCRYGTLEALTNAMAQLYKTESPSRTLPRGPARTLTREALIEISRPRARHTSRSKEEFVSAPADARARAVVIPSLRTSAAAAILENMDLPCGGICLRGFAQKIRSSSTQRGANAFTRPRAESAD